MISLNTIRIMNLNLLKESDKDTKNSSDFLFKINIFLNIFRI